MASFERPPDWAAATCLENLRQYRDLTSREVERVRRNLNGLSDDDKASLIRKPEEQVKAMEEAVAATLTVVGKLEELLEKEAQTAEKGSRGINTPVGTKPVQTLLQTFVREWSAEGLQERGVCFEKLLGAMEKSAKEASRVLLPASSLGRLAFDVASRGHSVEACEGRLLQWYGMELIRQHSSTEALRPQPFALNTCNRLKFSDNHRATPIPDVDVKDMLPRQRFGDFTTLYDASDAKESFDCLLSAYALDLSPNVFRFVRTAAHVLRPGGLWANFGPLAYDSDHDEAAGHGLELSWEELKFAISHFFEIQEEEWVDSFHAQNAESLMQMQYTCIYFKATRNSTPSPGIGQSS
mmetsp:Transcript_92465/g.220026  ORF Transcript_92465/g.220026 Transcript_92465/m.220026 type:complete len:353 (+) Transcript_92465:30-1088(+)